MSDWIQNSWDDHSQKAVHIERRLKFGRVIVLKANYFPRRYNVLELVEDTRAYYSKMIHNLDLTNKHHLLATDWPALAYRLKYMPGFSMENYREGTPLSWYDPKTIFYEPVESLSEAAILHSLLVCWNYHGLDIERDLLEIYDVRDFFNDYHGMKKMHTVKALKTVYGKAWDYPTIGHRVRLKLNHRIFEEIMGNANHE
jgi:hypothetical protein